ncbi:hypothetical protein [Leifsonia poae]|uniref:Uncharacterized protein n=1 Tax=Leifsonia poae TaxID=110933 RepID=A0A9W6HC59_9MICO|nr:hypothetical protein [Leifsonia poae]GLJ77349.1 hypothetical protein GCM10017584_29230 [Leifsonia poae]
MPTTDTITARPDSMVALDLCDFFASPHPHRWEYTNGHLVCAYCDCKQSLSS